MISNTKFREHVERLHQFTDKEEIRYLRHLSVHFADVVDDERWDRAVQRFYLREEARNAINSQ